MAKKKDEPVVGDVWAAQTAGANGAASEMTAEEIAQAEAEEGADPIATEELGEPEFDSPGPVAVSPTPIRRVRNKLAGRTLLAMPASIRKLAFAASTTASMGRNGEFTFEIDADYVGQVSNLMKPPARTYGLQMRDLPEGTVVIGEGLVIRSVSERAHTDDGERHAKITVSVPQFAYGQDQHIWAVEKIAGEGYAMVVATVGAPNGPKTGYYVAWANDEVHGILEIFETQLTLDLAAQAEAEKADKAGEGGAEPIGMFEDGEDEDLRPKGEVNVDALKGAAARSSR